VSEKLLRHAEATLNIPVYIYRPGSIIGDSKNGACNIEAYIHKLICGIIQMKEYPSVKVGFDWAPVDFVAKALVHISLYSSHVILKIPKKEDHVEARDSLKSDQSLKLAKALSDVTYPKNIFHLNHRMSNNSFSLFDLATKIQSVTGIPLQKIPFPQWRKKLRDSPTNLLTPLQTYFNKGFPKDTPMSNFHTQYVLGEYVQCPFLEEENIRKYIKFFVDNKYMEIKPTTKESLN